LLNERNAGACVLGAGSSISDVADYRNGVCDYGHDLDGWDRSFKFQRASFVAFAVPVLAAESSLAHRSRI
jgi:hypothetical protein